MTPSKVLPVLVIPPAAPISVHEIPLFVDRLIVLLFPDA